MQMRRPASADSSPGIPCAHIEKILEKMVNANFRSACQLLGVPELLPKSSCLSPLRSAVAACSSLDRKPTSLSARSEAVLAGMVVLATGRILVGFFLPQ